MPGRFLKAVMAGAISGPCYLLGMVLEWAVDPYDIGKSFSETLNWIALITSLVYFWFLLISFVVFTIYVPIFFYFKRIFNSNYQKYFMFFGCTAGLIGGVLIAFIWTMSGESNFIWGIIYSIVKFNVYGIEIGGIISMVLMMYPALADSIASSEGPWRIAWLLLSGTIGGAMAALVWSRSAPGRNLYKDRDRF